MKSVFIMNCILDVVGILDPPLQWFITLWPQATICSFFSYILNYVVYKAKINYHQHNSKTDYSITILKCQGTCPGIMIYSGKDVQNFSHLNFASVWPVLQISLLFDEEFSHHSPCNNDPLLWISSTKPWF